MLQYFTIFQSIPHSKQPICLGINLVINSVINIIDALTVNVGVKVLVSYVNMLKTALLYSHVSLICSSVNRFFVKPHSFAWERTWYIVNCFVCQVNSQLYSLIIV